MRKRSSCDGFQQSAVSVPVFTGSFDSVFSGSEEMAQSGAVVVQPCILCMGGAGLYYTDARLDSGLLYRRDSRGPFFAAGALPFGARGTDRIIDREPVAAWIFQVCGFCDWDGEQSDRV